MRHPRDMGAPEVEALETCALLETKEAAWACKDGYPVLHRLTGNNQCGAGHHCTLHGFALELGAVLLRSNMTNLHDNYRLSLSRLVSEFAPVLAHTHIF